MERVRRYLNEEESGSRVDDEAGISGGGWGGTPVEENQAKLDDEETRSFLSSGRIDGRSSDAKSIGSLSQHFFESDDNEDDKYIGTCNGYNSHPGSKSNLLLCTECDLRSKTCTYRPQTSSQCGRFVEERLDPQGETKGPGGTRTQQERRGGSTVKSPIKFEGSPRYWRDENVPTERSDRRTKTISAVSPSNLPGTSRSRDHHEHTRTAERQRDSDSRQHETKSPSSASYRSAQPVNPPRYHSDIDQRTATRRIEHQEAECDERKSKNSHERYRDSR